MTITQERLSAELAAKLFRGLADPTRLSVLLALQGGERRVVDLVAEVGGSQANISAHLACLKDCGLVAARPQGRASYYRIARPDVGQLLEAAEALLAAIGHKVSLCDRYAGPADDPAGGCSDGVTA
jgi:ArsR family transcriptional regulator